MNEEKYIKDKLSDYQSPMDMDQMWSQLNAGLDKEENSDDHNDEVDIDKEEAHIQKQFADYESPLDMDAMWAKLDASLAAEIVDGTAVSVESQDRKKGKLIPFLFLFLFLGGLATYGLVNRNSSQVQTENQNSTYEVKSSSKTESVEIPQKGSLNGGLTSSSQERIITTGIDSETNRSSDDKDVQSQLKDNSQPTLVNSRLKSPSATNTKKKKAGEYHNNMDSGATTLPSSSNSFLENPRTPTTKIPEQAEIKKPLAIKLPVLSNSESGIILDDQNVSLNPLFTLEEKGIEPLAYQGAYSYDPQKVEIKQTRSDWRVGLHSGFSIANANYSTQFDISEVYERIIEANFREKPNRNIAYGLSVEKLFSSGLKIASGLNILNQGSTYQARGELIDSRILETVPFGDEILTYNAAGEVISITEVEKTVERTYQVIENKFSINTFQVPLMVGYEIGHKKIDLSASAGFGVNYFYNNSGFGYDTSVSGENFDTGFLQLASSQWSLSGLAELQLGYAISDKFRLYSKLEFGKYLNDLSPFQEEQLYSARLNHFGLKAGISYLL